MVEEAQYETHKRKYEEETSPPPPRPRRVTGFSAPISQQEQDSDVASQTASYNNVPPPSLNEFELAKQKLQELASRALNNADAKRSKVDNVGFGSNFSVSADQKSLASNIQAGNTASIPVSHSYAGSKKIEIPNGRVGVIIGKAGETIKYLQIQSGARIQVTRDADHDPNSPNRIVELMGNQDQIAKAEQLIHEVLAEADAGGPGSVSRRTGGSGSEQFVMKVPNDTVGLVIGKGGETIKNIQSRSGARVQVIPLHPPPGDMSKERTVQINGSSEQIEIAKQMVNEVIENQNRHRNPAMTGGYSQQGYQARPPMNWAQQTPQVQQAGSYGYMQQSGANPSAPSQYNMSQPPYSGYPPQQTHGGYNQNWDQSGAPQSQGTGYDYYGQQQQTQQQQPPSGPQTDNSAGGGYNYNHPPASGGYGQQGYSQDGYGGGYHAQPAQPGYGPPSTNPQSGYDQQHGYGSTPGYGNVMKAPQDGQTPAYGTQGETGQAPPAQQGYPGQPSPNPAYSTPASSQSGYGPGYGQGQRTPPAYSQPQHSPSQGGYVQPSTGQPGYPPSQPPTHSGYGQPADSQRASTAVAYGGVATQPGAYPSPYSATPVTPPSYGQQPPAYYGGSYPQAPAYLTDSNAGGAAAPASAAQPTGAAKTSSES